MHEEMTDAPVEQDELCPECEENPCECEQREADNKSEMLQIFGARLSKIAQQRVTDRSVVEERWLRNLRQYHGVYEAEEQSRLDAANGSKVFINITRNKCNAAEARLSDMLFPTDDRNWGIKPTPIPELGDLEPEAMVDSPAGPVPAKDVAAEFTKKANKMAEAMQTAIEDQLVEGNYNAKARDIIHDAVVLGTGIFKGPIIIGKDEKRWVTDETGMSQMTMERVNVASLERVDPWDFYPDMTALRIDESDSNFERRRMNARQLREYAKSPGVLINQIKQVLASDAEKSTTIGKNNINDIRAITGVDTITDDTRYELWEYTGPISKDDLVAAGVEDIDDEDTMTEYEGVVHFIGEHVVKAQIQVMDSQERPYSVFSWEEDEASIFGFGVPQQMQSEQRMCNASVRMILDNGGLSVGAQTVIKRGKITPADGNYALTPNKLWYAQDEDAPINDAFASFTIPNNQAELNNVFSLGRQLADEVTNLPLIAQGDQSQHITKTAQGMGMLMNSANIVLRRAVKSWDDNITSPLIKRFYDWNMQFSEDQSIKGDFNIDARGSSALLERETQAKNIQIAMQMSQAPAFAEMTKFRELYAKNLQLMNLSADEIIKTTEEMEEERKKKGSQPPPEVQMKQMELKAQDAKDRRMHEYNKAKLVQDRELKIMELAERSNMSAKDFQRKVGEVQMKDKTIRDIAAGKQNVELNKQQLQSTNLQKGYDTF